MNKQQFEEFKKQNNFAAIAFQYWKEHKINTYEFLTEEQFVPLFIKFVASNEGGTIVTPGGIKRINGQAIMYKVLGYFDTKFTETWKMKGE